MSLREKTLGAVEKNDNYNATRMRRTRSTADNQTNGSTTSASLASVTTREKDRSLNQKIKPAEILLAQKARVLSQAASEIIEYQAPALHFIQTAQTKLATVQSVSGSKLRVRQNTVASTVSAPGHLHRPVRSHLRRPCPRWAPRRQRRPRRGRRGCQ